MVVYSTYHAKRAVTKDSSGDVDGRSVAASTALYPIDLMYLCKVVSSGGDGWGLVS